MKGNDMARVGTRLRVLLLGAMLATTVGMATPATAQTAGEPEVLFVGSPIWSYPTQPDVAYVTGVYRCYGGQPIHLWVSAKQGGPDPSAEGSGATSTSWYDTNISGGAPVVCDGKYRAVIVPIERYPNKARLSSGQAWVQFCLVSDEGIVASQSKYIRVAGVR